MVYDLAIAHGESQKKALRRRQLHLLANDGGDAARIADLRVPARW